MQTYEEYPAQYYPPAATMTPAAYTYNSGYAYSYPMEIGGDSSGVDAFAPPSAPQVADPTQNYGYNYTPDNKYYQAFEYSEGAPELDKSGGMSMGSETMNSYYSQQ